MGVLGGTTAGGTESVMGALAGTTAGVTGVLVGTTAGVTGVLEGTTAGVTGVRGASQQVFQVSWKVLQQTSHCL